MSVYLHPQLRTNIGETRLQSRISQNVEKIVKKVLSKFGGLKKLLYLCTTVRSEKGNSFENGSLIYWLYI